MINFTEAFIKALQLNDNCKYYQEYEKYYLFSSSESTGDFVLVVKENGFAVDNPAEIRDMKLQYSGKLLAEGSVFEKMVESRTESPTHSIRYNFEHKVIPGMFFQHGMAFMSAVASEDNILNRRFLDDLAENGIDNPYNDPAISIKPTRFKDTLIARIIFPEPEEDPLCYEAYALYDIATNRKGYFCVEKGGLDERPFLCGWSEAGEHLNFGHCTYGTDETIIAILKIFFMPLDESTPSVQASFDSVNNKVKVHNPDEDIRKMN